MKNNTGTKIPFTQRIAMFMQGRNGPDQLYMFCFWVVLALILVNIFFRSAIINALELVVIGYSIFRMFSKNTWKRQRENAKYLEIWQSVKHFFSQTKSRIVNRKTKAYRKCPSCKNTLCLPRVKGTHSVNCPCCHNRFDVKI